MLIFHMKEEQHVFTGFHFQSWHRGETRDVRRSFEEQSMHHCPSTVINEAGYTMCESNAQVVCTCPRDPSVKTDQSSTCILYFLVYTQPFIQKMSVYSQLKLACGVLTASRNTHCHRVLFLLFYRKRSNTVCVSMSVRLQMSLPIKLSRTCVCKDALTLFVYYISGSVSAPQFILICCSCEHIRHLLCALQCGTILRTKTHSKIQCFALCTGALFNSTLQFKLITKSSLSRFVYVTDSHTHASLSTAKSLACTVICIFPPRPLQLI